MNCFIFSEKQTTWARIEEICRAQGNAIGDLYDIDQMLIVCEAQEKILDGIIGLLASYYVFNIAYNEGKGVLSILEQSLLAIGRVQTLVSVTSFFNAIADIWLVCD